MPARVLKWMATILLAACLLVFGLVELAYRYWAREVDVVKSSQSDRQSNIVWIGYEDCDKDHIRPLLPWDLAVLAVMGMLGRYHPPCGTNASLEAARAVLRRRPAGKVPLWRELATAVWITRHLQADEVLALLEENRSLFGAHSYEGAALLAFSKRLGELSLGEIATLVCLDTRKQHCDPACERGARDVLKSILDRAATHRLLTQEEAAIAQAQAHWPARSVFCP